MSSLFVLLGWVVDATLKASVLIVLVAIAQILIGNRVAARWRYALWLVVVLRLVMPAAPSSPWSVFNLLPGRQTMRIAAGDSARAPIAAALPRIAAGTSEVAGTSMVATAWRWTLIVWLCGVVALILRSAIAAIRVHFAPGITRHIGEVDDLRRRLGIRRDVRIVESDVVDAPALHGLIRPVLFFPSGFGETLGREELRHVALHELWHVRRFDVAANWLLTAVAALHWFNPFVWFAVSRLREERELACDELALSCLEEDERLDYGRTILKLLECFRTAEPVPALVGIVDHKKKMKRRILMIASYTNRTRVPVLFVAALAVIGLVGLTDARGGERHTMMKKLDPAAMETIQKLGEQRITLAVKDASFGELLSLVSNATGVTIAQSPEAASSSIQQAKFSIQAQNIPAGVLLHSSLLPFHLKSTPDANGVTIEQLADGDNSEKHIEFHREIAGHGEGAGEGSNKIEKTITMRVTDDSKSTVNPDGSLHREVKVTMEENGVPSEGTLVLDIAGAPVTQ